MHALRLLILEHFVPLEESEKIFDRAMYDEEEDKWKLKKLVRAEEQEMMKRPVSALGNKRAVTEYERMAAAVGGNPRYKARILERDRVGLFRALY